MALRPALAVLLLAVIVASFRSFFARNFPAITKLAVGPPKFPLNNTLMSTSASNGAGGIQLVPFKSAKRGLSDHGWLRSGHSFPFAGHYRGYPAESWGALRVINEDRVAPTQGFGTHSHREFEM